MRVGCRFVTYHWPNSIVGLGAISQSRPTSKKKLRKGRISRGEGGSGTREWEQAGAEARGWAEEGQRRIFFWDRAKGFAGKGGREVGEAGLRKDKGDFFWIGRRDSQERE